MCGCFQKRIRKINEVNKIAKNMELDVSYIHLSNENDKIWSIKLGFNGYLTDEFRKKYNSVMKVRTRLYNDFYASIVASIVLFAIWLFAKNYNNDYIETLTITFIIFEFICVASILIHTKIIREFTKHDEKMVEEWIKKNENLMTQKED